MTYFHAPWHTYWHSTDGATWRQLPSVTQVIAGREPRVVPHMAAAQVRGTAVHAATAALHLGGDSTVDPAWQGYVDAYLRACADRRAEWVYVEQVLADPAVGVAGTVDRFGLVDDAYAVVDLKTTTATGRTAAHGHQLAGYAVLIDAAQPRCAVQAAHAREEALAEALRGALPDLIVAAETGPSDYFRGQSAAALEQARAALASRRAPEGKVTPE